MLIYANFALGHSARKRIN